MDGEHLVERRSAAWVLNRGKAALISVHTDHRQKIFQSFVHRQKTRVHAEVIGAEGAETPENGVFKCKKVKVECFEFLACGQKCWACGQNL